MSKKANKTSGFSFVKWGGIGFVVLGFVALIWYAAAKSDYIKSEEVELPLIKAPSQSVKQRAVDAGGMIIPHRDKQVFDLLQGTEAKKAEHIAAKVEAQKVEKQLTDIIENNAPIEPAKEPVAKVVEVAKPAAIKATGDWGVQLASFLNEDDAKKAAITYAQKFSGLLNALNPEIQKADLGSKGKRFRVRFMGLTDKASAQSLCRLLEKQNQGCFHVNS